jgi:thiol-disulfide isomerase/thioredoxin
MTMKSVAFILIAFSTYCLWAQNSQSAKIELWRGELNMNDRLQVPFLFTLGKNGKKYSMTIVNGEEKINLSCTQKKDSITALFPGIDAFLKFRIEGNEIRGYWLNLNKKKLQKIPLHASNQQKLRFEWSAKEIPSDVKTKYRVVFDDDSEKKTCVGIFKSEKGFIQGTIMTETGDYRFLDGNINGNSFKMSTFNGTWAMLVEGKIIGDSVVGNFYSGSSYRTGWRGKADDNAMLRKASSLTYVVNDETFNFSSIKMLNGKPYRPIQNSTLKLYQVMGSWCPNCLDEMVFFKELHESFSKDGLDIIAFAYENQQDISSALSKLKKFAKRMEIPYTVCYAGNASKEVASATFPMLNQIMSFPTSILVDRNGKIRHVHTGFSGPATGKVYDEYKEEMRGIIKTLLAE